MKAFFLLPVICILNFGCSTTGNMSAAINIQDVKFIVNPYILKKNEDYFLVYQIAIERGANVRHQIGEKIINNKYYYFFTGITSFPEYDQTVYRPVKKDENILRIFKSDSVFWLNPDNSELKLKIAGQ
jgi:hypothetical protein